MESTVLYLYIYCYYYYMPIVKCKICKKQFYTKPSHLKRGDGKYCSNVCSAKGRRRGKFVTCTTCGKEVWRMPRHLAHSKSKKYFCNKSCQTFWRNSVMYTGSNHPNWKGGFSSYRDMMIRRKIPKVCKRCKIRDFRLLSVHHLDENRKNNKIENLIWLCYNCHYLIHRNKAEKKKFMGNMV